LAAAFAQLPLAVLQRALLLEELVLALAEPALLLAQLAAQLLHAALLLQHFVALLLDLAVEILAAFVDLVLGRQLGLLDEVVGLLARLIGDLGHPGAGVVQPDTVQEAGAPVPEQQRDQSGQAGDDGALPRIYGHGTGHSFPRPGPLRPAARGGGCACRAPQNSRTSGVRALVCAQKRKVWFTQPPAAVPGRGGHP